ncbi:ABC-2 type transport system permease protein [Melghirimyces profundicolus]|uniref:ABC-2 type transport system permease protein n=1 Tax=Melghirimyces profundicolus TaxID=1242148 RepID=A0A2T6BGX8_9BACL|nr:ABC transporter permease [Melghirimyces profundicolus]PTX55314.1 ABC-2 type transport system permease protein [Melghirimyces profundicolus]
MRNWIGLVYNELLKMVKKKRVLVVLLITAVLIPIFTYGEYRSLQNTVEQMGTSDWRSLLQQRIIDAQNRLSSSRLPEEWKQQIKLNIQQQQYYLDHDINPTAPGAPTFVRGFVEEAVSLFLPLLVVVVASDIVSSEHSAGTIKLLLTRPVRRWRILLSKYLALLLLVSFIMTSTAVLGYLISGVIFGYGGWDMPVFTGFQANGGELNTESVHLIPQWQYILMGYGLAWFSCIAVATLSFMVSVLVRSTAASIGIMMAALISGSLLTQLAPTWTALKYLAFTNLRLTDYLSGEPSMIEGMTLPFSLTILGLWSLVGLVVAFTVFVRRDVLA